MFSFLNWTSLSSFRFDPYLQFEASIFFAIKTQSWCLLLDLLLLVEEVQACFRFVPILPGQDDRGGLTGFIGKISVFRILPQILFSVSCVGRLRSDAKAIRQNHSYLYSWRISVLLLLVGAKALCLVIILCDNVIFAFENQGSPWKTVYSLEGAACDAYLYFWHCGFGFPWASNVLNILHNLTGNPIPQRRSCWIYLW